MRTTPASVPELLGGYHLVDFTRLEQLTCTWLQGSPVEITGDKTGPADATGVSIVANPPTITTHKAIVMFLTRRINRSCLASSLRAASSCNLVIVASF